MKEPLRPRQVHSASFSSSVSASFTAFHARNRMLSAAPQNHQIPGTASSRAGCDKPIETSSAVFTLFGGSSAVFAENPAAFTAASIALTSAVGSSSAQIENVTP